MDAANNYEIRFYATKPRPLWQQRLSWLIRPWRVPLIDKAHFAPTEVEDAGGTFSFTGPDGTSETYSFLFGPFA